MNAKIYFEGGANGSNDDGSSSNLGNIECRKAFHSLLDKMGFKGRKPRLVHRNRLHDHARL